MLENIEIALRSDIAYLLGHKYGPLGYKDKENFYSGEHHEIFLNEIEKEIQIGKELFINHHKRKYNGNFPIWTITELISFGILSKLFKNLKRFDSAKSPTPLYPTTFR